MTIHLSDGVTVHLGLVALLWVVTVGAGLVSGLIVLYVLGAVLDAFTDWRQGRARKARAFAFELERRQAAAAWQDRERERDDERNRWARETVAKAHAERAIRDAERAAQRG